MKKTLLKRYYEIKKQIQKLSDELKEIEPDVYSRVFEQDGMKLTTDFCRFQIVYRPKWKYSDQLIEAENKQREKIKLLKKKEELDGTAQKLSDGGQLRMTDAK